VLKDIISLKLQSKTARKIARDRIVEILEENETLNCYVGSDVRKVFDIRDLFGHNLKKSVIENEVRKIIETMFVTDSLKKKFSKNSEAKNFEDRELHIQLSDIGIELINQVENIYKREMIDSALRKQKESKTAELAKS
jgi:hypothetical protein